VAYVIGKLVVLVGSQSDICRALEYIVRYELIGCYEIDSGNGCKSICSSCVRNVLRDIVVAVELL
jgi:hypothetical protein